MPDLVDFIQTFNASLSTGQLPQLGNWTYLALALLVAVEGPIATLLGAAAASIGILKPGWVFVAAAVGNLSADCIWYSIGYLGRTEWLFRFGRRLGISRERLETLENGVCSHAFRILFIAKLTMSFVIPALVAAGLVKVPWRRWLPAIVGGEIIWTGTLVTIGFYAAQAIQKVERGVEYLGIAGALVFIIMLIILVRRVLGRKYQGDMRSLD
jgi:membrane protein DedA with SNARE-associated domain